MHDGYAYGLDEGMLDCIDLATGDKKWKRSRKYGHGQVLLVGDLLLVQAEDGDIALVEGDARSAFTESDAVDRRRRQSWNSAGAFGRQAAGAQQQGSGLLRAAGRFALSDRRRPLHGR